MAARIAVSHPEQGWSLLCNGIVLFDDAGRCCLTAGSWPLPLPSAPPRSGCARQPDIPGISRYLTWH
jgi:hypothetical protein